MTVFEVLFAILVFHSLASLCNRIYQVITESMKLREKGQTPLTGRNMITVVTVGLVEILALWGFVTVLGSFMPDPTTSVMAGLVFLLLFVAKNGVAYLTAWGTVSIITRLERKKILEEKKKEEVGL